MDYFLGIDVGTTYVKAIAFSANGKVLCEQSGTYALVHPQPDRSEQDPDEILRVLIGCVENILHHFRQHPPVLVSFSAVMHSVLAVDEQGTPLSNCIIWADNRAADIASRLHREGKAAAFYHKTGVPVHAMSPFCKLLWLKENDPSLFQKAFRFIGIKEYIFFKLFGVYAVDSSVAAATGWMNIRSIRWDADILKATGLRQEQLSRIVPVLQVFRSPLLFPALKKVPFVIGGSDGAMANLGTASRHEESLVVSIGTSSAARVIVQGPLTDAAMRTFCYHIKDDLYLLGGAGNNGGIVLQWLREKFLAATEAFPDFLALASNVEPGSEGLVFLPYILGERAPMWNAAASGVLFGLTINHGRQHMIRAAMEGVVLCVFAMARPILEKKKIRQIDVTGGFAQNALWVQLLSDVFNLPVRVSETVENAAWGAVILGMEALGLRAAGEENIAKTFDPRPAVHQLYGKQFTKFEQLYSLLKEEF